jgi:hypothetical protein
MRKHEAVRVVINLLLDVFELEFFMLLRHFDVARVGKEIKENLADKMVELKRAPRHVENQTVVDVYLFGGHSF